MEERTGTIRCEWDDVVRNHYVYGHYTLDTNELFYVGISTHKRGILHSLVYQRAYACAKSARNKFWLRKYNKHGRKVVILYDNLTEKEAKNKEIELIAKYGTIIKRTGTLCNISEGGEGRFQDKSMCKKIYVYSLQGELINEFNSCEEAAAFYNLKQNNVGSAAAMKRKTCGGFQFRYEYNKDCNIQYYTKSPRKTAKPIIGKNVNTGEEKLFDSTYKFMLFINAKSNSRIWDVLHKKRGRKVVKGWELRYASV